jgi:hypothetical protein
VRGQHGSSLESMDTQLRPSRHRFELGDVEPFDKHKDVLAGLISSLIRPMMKQLVFCRLLVQLVSLLFGYLFLEGIALLPFREGQITLLSTNEPDNLPTVRITTEVVPLMSNSVNNLVHGQIPGCKFAGHEINIPSLNVPGFKQVSQNRERPCLNSFVIRRKIVQTYLLNKFPRS